MQLLRNGAVAKYARRQRDLETEPVLRLSDVQDISCVGRASYNPAKRTHSSTNILPKTLRSEGSLHTLVLLGSLDLLSLDAKSLAIVDV